MGVKGQMRIISDSTILTVKQEAKEMPPKGPRSSPLDEFRTNPVAPVFSLLN